MLFVQNNKLLFKVLLIINNNRIFTHNKKEINKGMNNVDEVIVELLSCLEFAYKLKFEGENEEQDLESLLDSISDTFK